MSIRLEIATPKNLKCAHLFYHRPFRTVLAPTFRRPKPGRLSTQVGCSSRALIRTQKWNHFDHRSFIYTLGGS